MGRFDAVLKDPEYLKLADAQKKEVWDGLFQKHVAADKEYGMLDEAQRGEVYQGFIQKYYSPQQQLAQPQPVKTAPTPEQIRQGFISPQSIAASAKTKIGTQENPYPAFDAKAQALENKAAIAQKRREIELRTRAKITQARMKRDQILREIEAGSQQAGMSVDQVKDFVNINGIDVPKSEWNKLRLRIANADLQPNNYTDPIEFNVVKSMEQEERVAQSQREINRLKKQMAETTDPSLLPIMGENLRKQELLQETYLSGMTKIEREGYALGREKSDSGAAGRMFGSFGKGGMDVLTLGMIPLLAPGTKLAKYLSAYEQGITAPTGRPLEDAFTSLALSAPLSMGFFIGGLAPAGARAAINTAMSLGMLMNTQGRKYATAYARYGSATATPDAATEGGALSAVLETAIETFSDVAQTNIVLGLTKRSGIKAAKNYVRKELSQRLAAAAGRYGTATLEAIGTEAAEELLQTAQDMVVDVATKQREVPTLPEAFQEIGYAAAVGALGGLTFGLLGGTVKPYVEFRTWRSVDKQAKSGNETAKRLMEARKLIEAGKVDEGYEVVKSDMEAIAADTFNETDENVTQAAGQMYDAYAMVGRVENPSAKLMDALIKAMDEGVDGEAAATIIEGTESIDDVISELRAATEEAKAAITTEEVTEAPVIAETTTSENKIDITYTRDGVSGDGISGHTFLAEGSESIVYVNKDKTKVLKISEPYSDPSPETYRKRIDNAILIDRLIGDGSLTLQGYYESKNGTKNPVFGQNYIEGKNATDARIMEYLESRGFSKVDGRMVTEVDGKIYSIEDYEGNFIETSNGEIVGIDASIIEIKNPYKQATSESAQPVTLEKPLAETVEPVVEAKKAQPATETEIKPEVKAETSRDYTEENLRTMGYDQIENYKETVGVGKYKGKTWRTAEYEATNAQGETRKYTVKVSSDGVATVKDNGKTKGQIEKEDVAEYEKQPQIIRDWLNIHLGNVNTYLKNKIAQFMDGKGKDYAALKTVFTEAELKRQGWEGVKTIAEIEGKLKDLGKLLSQPAAPEPIMPVAVPKKTVPVKGTEISDKKAITIIRSAIPKGRMSPSILKNAYKGKENKGYLVANDLDMSVLLKSNVPDGLYQIIGNNLEKSIDSEEDYPVLPNIQDVYTKSQVKADISPYVNDIFGVATVASTDENRISLTGVHIAYDGEVLSIVATDGRRVIERSHKVNLGTETFSTIIPAKAIAMVKKIGISNVRMAIPDAMKAIFNLGGNYVVTRQIETQYPEYHRAYEYEPRTTFTIDREELSNALSTLMPYVDKTTMSVHVIQTDGGIRLEAYNKDTNIRKAIEVSATAAPHTYEEYTAQYGNQDMLMPLRSDKTEIHHALNGKYLKDMIDLSDEKTIKLSMDMETHKRPNLLTLKKVNGGIVSQEKIDRAQQRYDDEVASKGSFVEDSKKNLEELLRIAGKKPISPAAEAEAKVEKPKLIKVEWMSKLEEVSDNIEGVVIARKSDWDKSEISEISGKEIVHIFWIADASGKAKPYGIRSAAKMLGLSSAKTDALMRKAKAEWEAKQESIKSWRREAKKLDGYKTLAGALESWNGMPKIARDANFWSNVDKDYVAAVKDGNYTILAKNQEERIEGYRQEGWEIISIKEARNPEAKADNIVSQTEDEYDIAAKEIYALENRAAALVYSNDGSGKAKPDNISADDWDRLWGLADGLIGKRYYDTLAPYEQQAKENREIDAWLTKIETNLALAPTEAEQVKSDADTRLKSLTAEQAEAERQMEAVRKQYEGTDKWMKAPNGKPTKLNERQWLQVRTPNFIAWFGDWINDPANASKVVDENGEPMVVYHGSDADEFFAFDAKRLGNRSGHASAAWGFATTNSIEYAQGYARDTGRVYQLFVNIKNPITLYPEQYYEIVGFETPASPWSDESKARAKYWLNKNKQGKDGIIATISNIFGDNGNNPLVEYFIFTNTQIKSATANTGEFSAENADIRYSPTADYQTANMIYKTEPISIEGITRAITSVIPKQWISKITTEGESARIVFVNGREVLVNALTGAIADQNGNPIAAGRTTINRKVGEANNVIAIIDIAKNYNNGNITAYHEGFHLAFNLMLSEAEQATVLRHYSGKNATELTRAERIDAEEMAARDFEHIMKYGKPPVPAKVKGVLARLWESIRTFVRKLMGKNYYDANFQILERIRTGEADTFNYNARDYFTNASDEALYRKIKDPLEGVKVTERQMQKAVYQIEKISDRVIDITRNLSEFGIKVTAVYNKTKSEAKRQLLINEFANYLEQALPHLPGFTRTEIADMVRSVNKVKSIRSFMRRLAMVEKKINNRYARKLYPAMQTMLKVSTKSAYQKDLLSRKRMVADEVLEKLNYIKSVFEMSQDKIEAEMLRLATTNEQVNDDAAANPEAAEIVNNETEWKMRYLELFSGLKREGVSKSGKKRVIYGSAERMAIAYEEIRSLIKTGKSMMQEMEAKRKEEHTRLIRQTIIALIGNKVYGDGIKTPLEKFQEDKSLNPAKAVVKAAKKGSAKILYLETIIENMSFASLRNHEGIKEYRAAKEKEFNEAIANAEDESKIPLMEFNRDQYLAAIDEIINVTANYKGLFKNWFQDTYFRPMYQAYRDRNAGLTQYTKIIHNMRAEVAKEVYGNEGLTDYLPALMSSTVQNIKISLLDPKSGKRVKTRISMQALGTMYAYSLNPDYADNVKNTGFDDIAIKQMMDIFASSKAGKYMQRWVERVTYEFYPMYYDTINNVFKERNGYSLGRELIYTPAIMDVKDKLKMPEIGNPSFAAIESYGIHLASHIARVNNNAAFKLSALNFDAQLTNHIHNNEHYKSHVMPMYNARTTILSQPVLAAIDATLGEEQRRALTSYYRDIAANGYVKQDVSNLVNQWMSNMSMAYMSFSPKVALKQVSSFAYAAAYMSPVEFAQHTAWVMSHPHIVAKIMRKSPTFNVRYKEGITSEQYLYLHMGSASSSKRLIRQQIGKYGNWSRYGDQAAALIGGGAIYRKEYLRLQNENPSWTKAQLEDAATYQMELFVDRTQQSASTLFTPQLRREGSFWRLATQFKTQKFAMYNAMYNSISELKYNKSNLDKALWMLVVLTMILPVMEWLGDMGFTEPGSVWDIYLGGTEQMVEMIPLYGEIASGLMLWAAKGESPDFGRTIPAVGGLSSLAKGLKQIDRAYDNWKEWGEVDIMPLMEGIAGASAPVTGMPIYPLIQNAKGITDFTSGEDERIMRLFGYSKGLLDYAEKTYGKEQE